MNYPIKKFKKIRMLVLDFDGVMTDNRVLVDENGKEAVFCNRSDGLGIEMLKKKGIEIVVISREKNKVVLARCQKLKIKCWHGIDEKEKLFLREVKRRNLKLENVCFVGNDITDLGCIQRAGVGIAVADSEKMILKKIDYITKKKEGSAPLERLLI